MRTVDVALGERSYPIHIGRGVVAEAGRLLSGRLASRRLVIVSNTTVSGHWMEALRKGLGTAGLASEVILVPDGEAHKNWATLQDVLTRLLEIKAERSTTLLALGGGVVGDLTGFAAAIYQRGMPFVQVPTTLLAQVDSSVGGKTGINHPLGKNMIGAFHQPVAVLIDTDCLGTLPPREYSAGMAEVIKYGAIRDAEFFAWLEGNIGGLMAREPAAVVHAIARSCEVKAAIVAADERETGDRALLNFGHTFGHAIEAGVGYGEWLHGEAVAAGMTMAARLSVRRGELPAGECERLQRLVASASLPTNPPVLTPARYLQLMGRDKKVVAGAIRFVLLRALGDAFVTADVAAEDLNAVLA